MICLLFRRRRSGSLASPRAAGRLRLALLRGRLPLGTDGAGVALITAIAFPVMLGFVGLATEAGTWLLTQRILQGVADAAAYSAGIAYNAGNTHNYATEGLAVAAQNGFPDGVNNTVVTIAVPPTDGHYTCGASPGNCNNYLEANVTQTQATLIARLFGLPSIAINAHSTVSLATPGNDCVLALNPATGGSVTLNGSASVNLSCGIAINSTSASALTLNGSASLLATSANIAGNVLNNGGTFSTPNTQLGAQPVADPYATTQAPAPAGCTFGAKTVNGLSATLSHGTYCGNITINGTSSTTVTVSPGTYILDRGSLIINGSPKINGAGVTFVFTSSTGSGTGSLLDNGSPLLNLTAPNSGSTAGFLFYQDRNASSGGLNLFNGASGSVLKGAVYFPSQALTYNGAPQQGPGCTQIIARTITFNGTPGLTVANCSGVGVQPIGTSPGKLVE